jgi:hypothetical protein
MGDWARIVGWSIVSALKSQRDLTLENIALRHQLMVLQRQPGRTRFKDRDPIQPETGLGKLASAVCPLLGVGDVAWMGAAFVARPPLRLYLRGREARGSGEMQ